MRATRGKKLQTILIGLSWLSVLLLQACSDQPPATSTPGPTVTSNLSATNSPTVTAPAIIPAFSPTAPAVPTTAVTTSPPTPTVFITPTPVLVQSKNPLLKLIHSNGPLAGQWIGVTNLAFSPNGKILAVGKKNGSVVLQNVADGKELSKFEAGNDALTVLTFSPDGKTLITGTENNPVLNFWSVSNGAKTNQLDFKSDLKETFSANYSPDGKFLAIRGFYTQCGGCLGLLIWSLATQKVLLKSDAATDYHVVATTFSPDNKAIMYGLFVITAPYLNLYLYNLDGKKPPELVQVISSVGNSGRFIINTIDGKLYTVTYLDTYNRKINTVTFLPTKIEADQVKITSNETEEYLYVTWLAYTPDKTRIISSTDNELIEVWDTKSGQQIDATSSESTYGLTVTALSPDGKYLVTGHSDGTVKWWEVK